MNDKSANSHGHHDGAWVRGKMEQKRKMKVEEEGERQDPQLLHWVMETGESWEVGAKDPVWGGEEGEEEEERDR